MWDKISEESAEGTGNAAGVYRQPEHVAQPSPDVITKKLIEDGDQAPLRRPPHRDRLPGPHPPRRARRDVPWQLRRGLVSQLASDDVVLTLIKDGDHRLSRPEDIERLLRRSWRCGQRSCNQ